MSKFLTTKQKLRKLYEEGINTNPSSIKNINNIHKPDLDSSTINKKEQFFDKVHKNIFDTDWLPFTFTPSLLTFNSTGNNFADSFQYSVRQDIELPESFLPFLNTVVYIKTNPFVKITGPIKIERFNLVTYNDDLFDLGDGYDPTAIFENNESLVSSNDMRILPKKTGNDKFTLQLLGQLYIKSLQPLEGIDISLRVNVVNPPQFETTTIYQIPTTDIELRFVGSLANPLYWHEDIKYKK